MTQLTLAHIRSLASVNVNLYIALAALIHTRSVTKAARQIGVTQSAMSQTLRQLRERYGDRLLERRGNMMVLTPLAERLAADLGAAVHLLASVSTVSSDFDPSLDSACFRVTARDQFATPIAEVLMSRWRDRFPNLSLVFMPYGTTHAIPEALLRRDIDAALVVDPDYGPEIRTSCLAQENFVCVMRAGHPLSEDGALTLESYVAADHAMIATTGRDGGAVDTELARIGYHRRVVLRMASFLGTPLVCSSTDLLVACPKRLAVYLAAHTDAIVHRSLPIASPQFTVSLASDSSRQDGELRFIEEELRSAMCVASTSCPTH